MKGAFRVLSAIGFIGAVMGGCPQGCDFGTCNEVTDVCACDPFWEGPSCESPSSGNDMNEMCLDNNYLVAVGNVFSAPSHTVRDAEAFQFGEKCVIASTSNSKPIFENGFYVTDSQTFTDYCCRGKGTVGEAVGFPFGVCTSSTCGGVVIGGGDVVSFSEPSSGTTCYFSCVGSVNPESTCVSSPISRIAESSVEPNSYQGSALGSKDCLIEEGTTVSGGFKIIEEATGQPRCCKTKGVYDSLNDLCRNPCTLAAYPFNSLYVHSSLAEGSLCFEDCYITNIRP